MALVGRQDGEAMRGRRGGNGYVLETRIMSTRPVKDHAGVPRLLEAERQDAPGIEMFNRCKPAVQVFRLRIRFDPDRTGNARFNLGDSNDGQIKPVAIGAHPGSECLDADLALRRRIG